MEIENIINEAIRVSIVNNILNMYSGNTRTVRNPNRISLEIIGNVNENNTVPNQIQYQNTRTLSSRYYNNPPQGGYILDEEHDYIFTDTDDLASLVFLDVATRFGSPENTEFMKDYRKNRIKKIGPYKKIKDGDLLLNNQCPICIDEFYCGEYQRTLNCNHSFHKKCIDKWFKKDKNDCPMCRTKILID